MSTVCQWDSWTCSSTQVKHCRDLCTTPTLILKRPPSERKVRDDIFLHFFNMYSISQHIPGRPLPFVLVLVCPSQLPDHKCQTHRARNNGVILLGFVFFSSLISIKIPLCLKNQSNYRSGCKWTL